MENEQERTELEKLRDEKEIIELRITRYRNDKRDGALARFYDDRVLSTNEFFMVGSTVRCVSGHFKGFPEIAADLRDADSILSIDISKLGKEPVRLIFKIKKRDEE